MVATPGEPIRIANCSGFFGDRVSAAREMVEDGPIDVLTGDWLAELTMLILARIRAKQPGGGFARTFVTQMEQVMGTCLDRGIKVVTNAGGLDPGGCGEAVQQVADRLGLSPTIATVAGDDLRDRLRELQAAGHELAHLETGRPLGDLADQIITANAYLGIWGAVEALQQGADIVITGRTTDAAVVAAPAAWHHGWARDDWDALAGAIVAGHVIECGAQATGGNYSFFTEIDDLTHAGFPWAEIAADGSSVIGKHDGTGGAVTVGTVTSQLLYEIGGPAYLNPDVISRFDTIRLEETGRDRVRITGVRGEPPPPTVKVAMNHVGGYRNGFTFCLTGLDVEAKAELLDRQLWAHVPGGREAFAEVHTQLVRTDHTDPGTNEEATALYRVTVKDPDERKVGRPFSGAAIELALASIPGFYGMGGPRGAEQYGQYFPALLPADLVHHLVRVGDRTTVVDMTLVEEADRFAVEVPTPELPSPPRGPTERAPLGLIVGARSGDKGGTANLGVFARSAEAFAWLDELLTVEGLRELMPHETADRMVERHRFPRIWSLNFLLHGLLEQGVAASSRQDAQAKSLGEYLRAKVVEVPVSLLRATGPA